MPNLIPHYIYSAFQAGTLRGSWPGAALFVDVTGFTAISEALMTHGKDGCEVLTQTLNSVLSPLVEVVYAYGGFISNFAGDAFLALFPGSEDDPDHEQARLAALFIREFFEQLEIVNTPYGSYRINVRVGMGTGEVEWGIIPAAGKHTYFFRGTAVETALEAQSIVHTGEIGVYTGAGYRTLDYEGQSPLPIQTHFTTYSLDELRPFVPDEVLDVTGNGEFRSVVSVFVGFARDLPTETLSGFIQTVFEAAARYEGYVNKLDFNDKGGGVTVFFGAPTSHENDLVRAADFLLLLRERSAGVSWHAGLTSGMVYAGFVGGRERSEYTVIGTAVNLAARLMSAADEGRIWLAGSAADGLLAQGYELLPMGEHTFKGLRQALPVYDLAKRSLSPADHQFFRGAFVGRGAEVERLNGWLGTLQQGQMPGVMLIHAEAGVGKSRLLAEMKKSHPEYKWFFCVTDEVIRQSLNPFRYFLRQYFNLSGEQPPEANKANLMDGLARLAAALPSDPAQAHIHRDIDRAWPFLGALVDLRWEDSLYETLDPKLRAENIQLALKNLLLAESLCQPVVLVIEDGHWLDSDSWGMLRMLTRNVAAYPLAVIITSRYQDDGSPLEPALDEDVTVAALDLGMLDAATTQVFAASLLDGEVDGALAQLLQSRAEGNPFFTEQLLLDLKERGSIAPDAAGLWKLTEQAQTDIPMTINAVLVARLDRLREEIRRVVQTAAVLGREFEITVLSNMLRDDPLVEHKVREAEKNTIWVALAEIRYIFHHALLREAAYQMLFRTHLSELHRLAAQAIEQLYQADLKGHYTDLVYHYHEAGDEAAERQYARLAGEQAFEQFANNEALDYFNRALSLTVEPEARYELLLRCEEVLHLQGSREEQERVLGVLESLITRFPGRGDMHAEVVYRQSRYQEVTGQLALAAETAQNAITMSAAHPEIRAQAYLQWGLALQRQSFYPEAGLRLKEGLELAQQHNLEALIAKILRALGSTMLHVGDYPATAQYYSQALVSYRQLGDRQGEANILSNLGAQHFMQGNYDEARKSMEAGLALYREIGDRYGEGFALGNIGALVSGQNDHYAALRYLEQTLKLNRETRNRFAELYSLSNMGTILIYLGDYEAGERYTRQALDLNLSVGNRQRDAHGYTTLCLVYCQRKQFDTAYTYAEKAIQITRELEMPSFEALALKIGGLALEGLGRADDAKAAYERALMLERELGEEHLTVETVAGLARVALSQGDQQQALDYISDSLELIDKHQLIGLSEPSRVLLTCYDVLTACQDGRAAAVLERACAELHSQAALIEDEQVRHSFLNNVDPNRRVMELGCPDLLP